MNYNYNLKLNKETIHQGIKRREYLRYSFKARILAQDSDAIHFCATKYQCICCSKIKEYLITWKKKTQTNRSFIFIIFKLSQSYATNADQSV